MLTQNESQSLKDKVHYILYNGKDAACNTSCLHNYVPLFINLQVSFHLQLSKYIDSDHLCYIYLVSFINPEDLSPESITFQTCEKDL